MALITEESQIALMAAPVKPVNSPCVSAAMELGAVEALDDCLLRRRTCQILVTAVFLR